MSNHPVITDYLQAKPTIYSKSPRLAGKVCIVTGATGGIGSATVLRFAEEGAKGIVVSDLDQALCEQFVANLKKNIVTSNTEYLAIAADVSKDEQQAKLFDQAIAKWGHVHVAVANAGKGSSMTPLLDETEHKMREMYEINTLGVWLTAKHAARVMLRDGRPTSASIIINSSVAALYGAPAFSPYAASKWAARGIGLSLAQELGPQGIRVNNIHPGGTLTPLFHQCFTDEVAEVIRKSAALQRLADPIEIANGEFRNAASRILKRERHPYPFVTSYNEVMLFLASDESSYVSGATIGVHGAQVP
ncbi:hypothetical protein CBS101457_000290 [Exobasidium rhododendri]|nr:hypothetical protein CBS101457_000290 [Exobasidium rhododendri]